MVVEIAAVTATAEVVTNRILTASIGTDLDRSLSYSLLSGGLRQGFLPTGLLFATADRPITALRRVSVSSRAADSAPGVVFRNPVALVASTSAESRGQAGTVPREIRAAKLVRLCPLYG